MVSNSEMGHFLTRLPIQFSSVHSLSHIRLFATPWIAARQASLSITNPWSLPKLMSIKSVIPSSHLILCRPLLLLPPILPSIRVFSNESTRRMRWPKYWSFRFSISPSNEHPELISFRMDWLDLLAVQRTLKSLLQQFQDSMMTLLLLPESSFILPAAALPTWWYSLVPTFHPSPSLLHPTVHLKCSYPVLFKSFLYDQLTTYVVWMTIQFNVPSSCSVYIQVNCLAQWEDISGME